MVLITKKKIKSATVASVSNLATKRYMPKKDWLLESGGAKIARQRTMMRLKKTNVVSVRPKSLQQATDNHQIKLIIVSHSSRSNHPKKRYLYNKVSGDARYAR